ncbi:T9SS type A sorting domain-containing protein [candidate division WOR-3 bacterium]|nr:T9SS type A sorting domain-containing protein [candidate division WOR-3 bacterium]
MADNITINYNGSDIFTALQRVQIGDPAGNNNGRMDPGEPAEITVFLKNIGGAGVLHIWATLFTIDPYLLVTDGTFDFGPFPVDATVCNSSDVFRVQASPSTPQGHVSDLSMEISDHAGYSETLSFSVITGQYDYLVWNPDSTPESGQLMDSILSDLGYLGHYGIEMPGIGLEYYRSLFVCTGFRPYTFFIDSFCLEKTRILNYINQGGRVYLEGNSPWCSGPYMYHAYDFSPVFGINPDYGSIIHTVLGQNGTMMAGMNFVQSLGDYAGDIVNSLGAAQVLFKEGTYGDNICVAYDAGTYKTIGAVFEIGSLVDGTGISTKRQYLQNVMTYFGVNAGAVEETPSIGPDPNVFQVYPNPFLDYVDIVLSGYIEVPGELMIYDVTGRTINTIKYTEVPTVVRWSGNDFSGVKVARGQYFVEVGGRNKLILKY